MNRYREDIDGLRAIAVLPVVFYHVGWSMFSGGFVGVDIFFVISGYLITSIILREIQRGEFSMWRFYERRIRRIYPAVLAVCVFVIVAGALLLPAQQFKRVGQALISMNLYASNILFFKQSDYFNADSELNPFLHTWSLSVEEQFYLIFPVFLLFVFKLFKNEIHACLTAAILISLVASSFSVFHWPMATFYLIPFRAWELAFGAFLAAGIPRAAKTQSALLSGIGILCMLYSIFFYSSATPFPGAAALLPCLGAAVVIYGGGSENPVNRWLGNPVFRHFGLISYSLYLWHWPVFVFGRYLFPNGTTLGVQLLQIAIAWVCAYLSWRYIEAPFRQKNVLAPRKSLFTFFGATTVATFLLGGLMVYGNGFMQRMPPAAIALEKSAADSNPRRGACHGDDDKNIATENYCTYGAEVTPTVALWGDSHGAEISPALGALIKPKGLSLKAFTYSQCPPALEFTTTGRTHCVNHNNQVLAYLEAHPEIKVVFMIANYHIYEIDEYREAFEAGFSRSVNSLEAAGKKVVTIYPFPGSRYSIPIIAAAWAMQGRDIQSLSIPSSYYQAVNARAVAFLDQLPNTARLHPENALCQKSACAITQDGRSLYFDSGHLGMYGANYVIEQLANQALALATNAESAIATALPASTHVPR